MLISGSDQGVLPVGGAPGFVWHPATGASRNGFVLFERSFDLQEVPGEFPLHLFADTRYRLRVNGDFLGSGPARFVTTHPEYDSYDLSGCLRAGRNVISVEVNFYGASSFQTMPDGHPGFIAWGGGAGICLATPGDWLVAELVAWRADSPLFSFAQGPVEICDTRKMMPGEFVRPEAVVGGPWGDLAPYSGREIRGDILRPMTIEVTGALQASQRILGVMVHGGLQSRAHTSHRTKQFSAIAIWIRSPREQQLRISSFWADLLLNGIPVPCGERGESGEESRFAPLGNHQQATLDLKPGWNLLTATFEVLTEYWALLLGFPRETDVTLHGLPEESCEWPIAALADVSPTRPAVPQPGDKALPDGWVLQDGAPPNLTPARVCGWDELLDGGRRALPAARLSEMSPIVAEGALWCLRFEGEFLGYPVVDVDAPEGAVMDVACDDWQTPKGTVALYKSNPFTDSVDRFILKGGRQRVELFHVRGGKFLQIVLRAPRGPAPLSLQDVFVRSRQTPQAGSAAIRSGNETLDWTFKTAQKTLAVSTSSAYTDCPWRERGTYIGDCLVAMHLDFLFFQDARTARRVLRQFAQAVRPDGLLPAAAPAWLRYSFGDYTLIWILALRDYWALTGDTETVGELWPVLEGIWASPAWKRGSNGLWDTAEGDLFIDWGVLPSERLGAANATLNIFRHGALRASAELALARSGAAAGKHFLAEAEVLEQKIFARLWCENEGRLAPSLGATSPALHANILALHFGIGSRDQQAAIMRYIEPLLVGNFSRGIELGQFSGHAELYFFYFLLPALATQGRPDLAERLIEDHYGYLRKIGDDTLPECFCRVQRAIGSRCHSWSGGPAVYAARHVLGIQPSEPGNPNAFVFHPSVHAINSASGRIAHQRGWIDIAWTRRSDGSFDVQWSAPEGVSLAVPAPR